MRRSILLVDDHPATLLGLHSLLAQDTRFEVLGVAKDGGRAIERATTAEPDLVCLDLGLPGGLDGFAVCQQLTELAYPPAVVVYTGHEEAGVASRARAVGASGVVAKSEASNELIEALVLASRGRPYVSPTFARTLTVPTLSARQQDVLALLAEGMGNDAIAAELGLSLETVKTHVRAILHKLQANHRTQAVASGLRNSLIL